MDVTKPIAHLELHQQLLRVSDDVNPEYDVVIIGSGCGGGLLAWRLQQAGIKVALIEAGSLNGLTHFANLPRKSKQVDYTHQNIDLYHRVRAREITSIRADYLGGPVFGFGGKTLLWGGLAPRMTPRELAYWPTDVANDLLRDYYNIAEDILGIRPRYSSYDSRVADHISATVGLEVKPAGFAFGHHGDSENWRIFSIVDLFVDSILEPNLVDGAIDVFLQHPTEQLLWSDSNVVAAVTRNLANGKRVEIRGKCFVLAAGVIGSPMLVRRSSIDGAMIGSGLTDHPVQYLGFYIEEDSPIFDPNATTKLIVQLGKTSPYNVLLHINTDLGATEAGKIFCEIVILHSMHLVEKNCVYPGSSSLDPFGNVIIDVGMVNISDEITREVTDLAISCIESLNGKPLTPGGFTMELSLFGDAGNEVGTLRMSTLPESGFFDSNLKCHSLHNLYGCDASVFPFAPAANPALTISALAVRLADHLALKFANPNRRAPSAHPPCN